VEAGAHPVRIRMSAMSREKVVVRMLVSFRDCPHLT
jgi:hypothetical protein